MIGGSKLFLNGNRWIDLSGFLLFLELLDLLGFEQWFEFIVFVFYLKCVFVIFQEIQFSEKLVFARIQRIFTV